MCPIAGGEKRGNLVVVIVATALSLCKAFAKKRATLFGFKWQEKKLVFVALLLVFYHF